MDIPILGRLLENEGDFVAARLWVAHDRGAENREILEAGPERTPYLYDEAHDVLVRLPAPAPGF